MHQTNPKKKAVKRPRAKKKEGAGKKRAKQRLGLSDPMLARQKVGDLAAMEDEFSVPTGDSEHCPGRAGAFKCP